MTDIEQKMQTLLDEARIGIPLASEWAIQRVALRRAIEQHEALEAQIDRLASFVMHCIEGEPSQSQGAVDTAIRIMTEQATTIGEQLAEVERLRGVLEAVWKEATTMRNASKLVGPYPKEPANNRIWARSMYHAGKKLHELIKPIRAALGEKQ